MPMQRQAPLRVERRRPTDAPDVFFRVVPDYDPETQRVTHSALLITAEQAQQLVDGLALLGVFPSRDVR